MKNVLKKILEKTKFADVTPMVPMSACPGADASGSEHPGMDVLLDTIKRSTRMPMRNYDEPFLFAVDHCFPIKGQGTVLTGTVLRGQVQVQSFSLLVIPASSPSKPSLPPSPLPLPPSPPGE